MKASSLLLLLSLGALMSCAERVPLVAEQFLPPPQITKITVIGYGSASAYEKYNEGQRKLMAMRASKLDAYRAIAEQVYGVKVVGGSTVGAMVATNDGFRVNLDAHLRGARVVSVAQATDGTFETTMELEFDESVIRRLAVFVPLTPINRSQVGAGGLYGSSYYFAQ